MLNTFETEVLLHNHNITTRWNADDLEAQDVYTYHDEHGKVQTGFEWVKVKSFGTLGHLKTEFLGY